MFNCNTTHLEKGDLTRDACPWNVENTEPKCSTSTCGERNNKGIKGKKQRVLKSIFPSTLHQLNIVSEVHLFDTIHALTLAIMTLLVGVSYFCRRRNTYNGHIAPFLLWRGILVNQAIQLTDIAWIDGVRFMKILYREGWRWICRQGYCPRRK